ncbi:MAG: hypothetical protein LIP09_12230 [Bacteroidales bacterium]|nr:hypothetical protein [Bacteroidales bacterium]
MTVTEYIKELKKLDSASEVSGELLNRILSDGYAIREKEAVMALDKGAWTLGTYVGLDEKGIYKVDLGNGRQVSCQRVVPYKDFNIEEAIGK